MIAENILHFNNPIRSIPRELLKCGLFAVRARNNRVGSLDDIVLYDETDKNGRTILSYNGRGLNQDDLCVYLELLELGKKHPKGNWFEFSKAELMKSLNWDLQTRYRKKLFDCIRHLKNTEINGQVIRKNQQGQFETIGFSFNLVSEYNVVLSVKDKDGKEVIDKASFNKRNWKITLPHGLHDLSNGKGLALIDVAERQKLKGNLLAQFIHAYLASNKYDSRYTPTPELLYSLSGSARKSVKEFKAQDLKPALKFINDAEISYKVCIHEETGRLSMAKRSIL